MHATRRGATAARDSLQPVLTAPPGGGAPRASLRTSDPAEAQYVGEQLFYPQHLIAFEPAQLRMCVEAVQLGPVIVSRLSYGTEIRIDCRDLESGFQFNRAIGRGTVHGRCGTSETLIEGTRAAVFNPTGRTQLRRWSADATMIGIKIDREFMHRQLEALLGHPTDEEVRFELPVAGDSPEQAALLNAVEFASSLLPLAGPADLGCLVADRLAEIIVSGLLLTQPSNHLGVLRDARRRPAPPRAVREIRNAVIADPGRRWTAAELASVAGVGVRAAQQAFRSSTGRSLFQFVTDVRLDRVRQDLLRRDGRTIGEIALDAGFAHLGRFAQQYQQRFGELPRDTARPPQPG